MTINNLKFFQGQLGDDDKYFFSGIITVATVKEGGPSIKLTSANPDDEREYCTLTIKAFKKMVRVILPPIVKPYKVKQVAKYWSEEDIKRMGRDWYWKYFTRSYGFSFWEDSLFIDYGLMSGDSADNPKTKLYSLPWKTNRFVRHTVYDLQGNVYLECKNYRKEARHVSYDEKQTAPKATFKLLDLHDRSKVTASVTLQEREWHLGTGMFRFLAHLVKPTIHRSFDIEFSEGVGAGKEDWKGGIIGMSVNALPGELHIDGIKRLCESGITHRGKKSYFMVLS